jgi:septal ring factor EnvC (AmiA/AmiB activator)
MCGLDWPHCPDIGEYTSNNHWSNAINCGCRTFDNSLGSGPIAKQPEGAISGLSNLKRKIDKIDQERELFKAEHAKLEDEVSSVTNSLSKSGDEIIAIRQDMKKLGSTLREELAEFKNIWLSMSETKNTPSPRRKAHR